MKQRGNGEDVQSLKAEIVRLNKMVQALMNRVERSTDLAGSDFDRFQTSVMLENRVRSRTQELEEALRENEHINRALREAEQKLHSVLDQSLVGITLVSSGRFHYANLKFADIVGYGVDELMALGPADLFAEGQRDILGGGAFVDGVPSEFTANVLRKDGRLITVEVFANSPIKVGGEPAVIAVWADITERLRNEHELKVLQEQLHYQAMHDPLTGLNNRLYLHENLERELALSQRHGYPVSVIMTDIDHFKAVNDTYGHLAGDAVLKHFADIMRCQSRVSDFNCRYGGEEFVLVLPNTSLETACERAEQMRQTLAAAPVEFQAEAITVTASFGVVVYLPDKLSVTELIGFADNALYAAKKAGRNRIRCCAEDGPIASQL